MKIETDSNDEHDKNLRLVYQELCNSYRAIDDFRAKLLGFLPLASGTGIFLLFGYQDKIKLTPEFLTATGLFGFFVTLGLFFYELYGIRKCTRLIMDGQRLEKALKIDEGQFKNRPGGALGFINEPAASGVIYSAVMAVWVVLGMGVKLQQLETCATAPTIEFSSLGVSIAVIIFFLGSLFAIIYAHDLRSRLLSEQARKKTNSSPGY